MRIKPETFRLFVLLSTLVLMMPANTFAETIVSGSGGGVFPPDSAFNGVPISALQFGYGLDIADAGNAAGQFCTILLGAVVGDVQQRITIDGIVTSGARTAANAATYTGTVTVNMGNGTPPTAGVLFTATVVTDAASQGTLALVIGSSTLPTAAVNEGSQTVK